MTLKELREMSAEEVAKFLFNLGACPDEERCVCEKEGDLDCVGCWVMHLNGESREPEEDPKADGRGYRV